MNVNTVGDLRRILEDYDDEEGLIFVEHPNRGSSVFLAINEVDQVRAQREHSYNGALDDEQSYLCINIQPSGQDFFLAGEDEDEEAAWPGRSNY